MFCFFLHFSPPSDNYYQKAVLLHDSKKTPVSLMFSVCHSKLTWKQESVWCQHRRMSNADVEVFNFNARTSLWLRPSEELLLCLGSHKERHGEYNWFHCTRFSIFFYCFMYKVLTGGLTRNRCRINPPRETSAPSVYRKYCINMYRETSTVATTDDFSFSQHNTTTRSRLGLQ